MNKVIYDIKGLSYRYLERFPALEEINLSVEKSDKVALLGANGSGKSTLLLVLAGLVFPGRGSVKFMGRNLTEEGLLSLIHI